MIETSDEISEQTLIQKILSAIEIDFADDNQSYMFVQVGPVSVGAGKGVEKKFRFHFETKNILLSLEVG